MPTVLYADDDRDNRELFAFFLRQSEYQVYEAINGAQAVQFVRDEQIDLVILNVRMPMMSGYDAAHMISEEAPDIPIMFLSCRDLRHQVQKGFDSGPTVVDYLVKNMIQPDQLVQRVGQILELSHDLGLEAVRQSAARTRGLEAVRQESLDREKRAYEQR